MSSSQEQQSHDQLSKRGQNPPSQSTEAPKTHSSRSPSAEQLDTSGNSLSDGSQVCADQSKNPSRTGGSKLTAEQQEHSNKYGHIYRERAIYNNGWSGTYSRLPVSTTWGGGITGPSPYTSGSLRQRDLQAEDIRDRMPEDYKSEVDAAIERGRDVEAIKKKYKGWGYDPQGSSKGGNA